MTFIQSQLYRKLPSRFFSDHIQKIPTDKLQWAFRHHALLPDAIHLDDFFWGPFAPCAMAYAGHQFGHFAMLGDGRACYIGDSLDPQGGLREIHIKGCGPSVFSRRGDGLAALGPMLREVLISEFLAAVGVPTTRSLGVVATGLPVYRETTLRGAALIRSAHSHVRVGTFEFAAASGQREDLAALLEWSCERHGGRDAESFLQQVVTRQAKLIAQWQSLGFIHGVMNTDNMAISGESLDFGPCAFMEQFHEDTVFSSIDRQGRYAYGQQPRIAMWNLARLCEALMPLVHHDATIAQERCQGILDTFVKQFHQSWQETLRRRTGLDEDGQIVFFEVLKKHNCDFTLAMRACDEDALRERLPQELTVLMSGDVTDPHPRHIPRNHLVERVIAAAESGDLQPFHELLEVVQHPFARHSHEFLLPAEPHEIVTATFCGT